MYLGIDLGTSNSAIAGLQDGSITVFKTPEGHEVMPSVIYRNRRGHQTVGVRAYDQFMLAPENTVHGFKRLMGTATPLHFGPPNPPITPEEASAEILRALVGLAMIESGAKAITGAVVTTPAAFNQMQSEGTLAAAHAAGLDRVALLQEPVAAALAAIALGNNHNGLFLIYDFGGGTFDAALVQAIEGSVTILAHEGVNMLGGRDFDRLILDNVVRPWLTKIFRLPANPNESKQYERMTRIARHAAEIAKIDLSTRESTTISAGDELIRAEDLNGEPIYLDVPISRKQLERLVHDPVTRSIELCRKLLADNGYAHEDLSRVVLVGGPTKMPVIRQRIQDELGIEVEDPIRIDPMTAVAKGAAIFCESRDWSTTTSTAKPTAARIETDGNLSVSFDYETRTPSETTKLIVAVASGDATGISVQVDSEIGTTSGRHSLTQSVTIELRLPDRINHFTARVFDAAGRPVAHASRDIVIERTLSAAHGIPATQTIGVKVLDDAGDNTLDLIVKKGTPLPVSGVTTYRVAEPLRSGESAAVRIELYQVDNELVLDPEQNLAIGEFRIDGVDLPDHETLRRGDEIKIHWAMGDTQRVVAEVEIPRLQQRFAQHNFYDYQATQTSFEGETGLALVDDDLDRAEKDLEDAASALPVVAGPFLKQQRYQLEVQRGRSGVAIDADERRSISEEARRIRQVIAAACVEPRVRQQILRRRIESNLSWYDQDVRRGAAPHYSEKVDVLVRNARVAIEAGDEASLHAAERMSREIVNICFEAGMKQFAFCAMIWAFMRKTRHLARDPTRFDTTVQAGDDALHTSDLDKLRSAMYAVWANRRSTNVTETAARASLMRQ